MRISDWSSECALPISLSCPDPLSTGAGLFALGLRRCRADVRVQRASGILFANCLGSLPDTHLEHHGIGCGLSGFRSRQALHCSTGCGIRQKRTFREVIRLRSRKLPVRAMVRTCRICRRSEEHTSELQSLMRISYAVFCLKKKRYIIMLLILFTTS